MFQIYIQTDATVEASADDDDDDVEQPQRRAFAYKPHKTSNSPPAKSRQCSIVSSASSGSGSDYSHGNHIDDGETLNVDGIDVIDEDVDEDDEDDVRRDKNGSSSQSLSGNVPESAAAALVLLQRRCCREAANNVVNTGAGPTAATDRTQRDIVELTVKREVSALD